MPTFDAENGTEGVVVTSANSGGFSVNASTALSNMYFMAAAAWNGTLGYRLSCGSGITWVAINHSNNQLATTGNYRCRFYIRINTTPPAEREIISIARASNTGRIVSVFLNASRQLVLKTNGTNTSTKTLRFTSTMTLALNTWYRVELVVAPGTATNNGKVGLGCVPAANTITTTNNSTNIYYYSATLDLGASLGISQQYFGRTETGGAGVDWAVEMDVDDLTIDNNTFTNLPTSWIGKSPTIFNSVIAMAASSSLTIASTTVQGFKNSVLSTSALGSLTLFSDIQKSSVLSTAAIGALLITGDVPKSASLLPMDITTSMLLGQLVSHIPTLSVAAGSSLTVSGLNSLSAVLPMAGLGSLTISGFRGTVADLAVAALSAMSISGLKTMSPTLVMGTTGGVVIGAGEVTWSTTLPLAASGALLVAGLKTVPSVLPLIAVGSLAISGLKTMTAVLAVRGIPALTVAPSRTAVAVLAVRATPALIVAGQKSLFSTLSMAALGQMAIAVLVIGDIHPDLDVIAIVLGAEVLATPFDSGNLAVPLSNGIHLSPVLEGTARVIMLSDGMLAVIQD